MNSSSPSSIAALVQAREHTAEAKARLDRIQQILSSGAPDLAGTAAATVTDTLHNDVITKLRQKYLEYQEKEADFTRRYGPRPSCRRQSAQSHA